MLGMAGITRISGFANSRLALFAHELSFWQHALLNFGGCVTGLVLSVSIARVFRTYWAIVAGQAATMKCTVLLGYLILPYRPRIDFMTCV